MEAEMLSLCDGVCEGKWIKNLIEEIEFNSLIEKPIPIFTDSQSLIHWIKNPKISNRCKHINRKYYFVRDDYEKGDITINYTESQKNEADILTKDLSKNSFLPHIKSLGLVI